MRIILIAVGKIKDRALRKLLDDYAKRISRYATFEEIEVKDGPPAQVQSRIDKAIPVQSKWVTLEVTGKPYTSIEFSHWIESHETRATSTLAFVLGGAYGLPSDLSKRADFKLSLSTMTLPHRLARLLLLEQIYRAFSISRGQPYAHE